MATVTTAVSGLTRSAYADAVKTQNNAAELANLKESLASAQAKSARTAGLLKELRFLHVANFGVAGSDNVAAAISEIEYNHKYAKRDIANIQSRIAALEGNAPLEDDDE